MSKRGRRRSSRRRKSSSSSKQSISQYICPKQNKNNSVDDITEKGETDSYRRENLVSGSEDEEKCDSCPPKEKKFKQDHQIKPNLNQWDLYTRTSEDRDKGVKVVTSVSVSDLRNSSPKITFEQQQQPLCENTSRCPPLVTNVINVHLTGSNVKLEIEESLNCLKTTVVFLKDNGTDSQTDSVRACDSRRTADDDSHDLPCQNLPGNSGDENTNLSSTNVFSFGRPNSFNPTIMSEKFSFVCQNQQVPTERQSSPATTVNAEPWEKRNNFHKRFSINQFWDIPPPQEFADISGNIMEEQRNVSSLSKNSQDNHMTFNGTHNGESTEDRGDLTSSPDQFSESDNYSLFARTSLSTNRSSFTQEFINSQRRRSWIRNNSIDTVEHRGCPLPMKRRQTFPGMLGGPGSMQEDLLLPCAESFSSLNMCSSRRENVEEIRQTLERLSDISSETEDSPKPASERRDRKQLVLTQFCSLSSEVAPEDVFTKQSPSLGNVTYHCEDLQQRFKDMDHLDIGGREYKAEHSEVEDSGFDQEMVETDHHSRERDSKDSGGQTFSIHVIPPSCSGSEEQMLESQTVQLIPNDLLQDQSVLAAPEDKSSVMTMGSLEHRFLQMDIGSTTSSQMEKACAEDTHVSVPQDGHAESPDKGAKASSEKEDFGSSQQTTAEEKKDQGRFSRRSTRAEIHTREQLSRSLTDRQLKCSSLEVKEHLKPLMHKDVETSSGSDHWARRRKLFKESKQWSSAGGSSVTSDITEESVSEESPSVDMTVRDNEDGGFYMETFHSSTWIYQGDNLGPEVIPSSLNTRTRASAIRERTVQISKGSGEYPWGFRIQFSKPIVVTEVDTNGAAEEAGLMVGDYVLAVNGIDVTSIPHSEAADLARQGPDDLTLTIGSDIARGPNTPRPSCRGYLHKRTQSGLIKGWRRRWFVLTHDCCLQYHRHKRDEGKRRALSAVKLEGADVGPDSSLGKPFVFKCRPLAANRVFFFCATSNQEMKRWLEAMERAIHPVAQNHVWVDVTRHNSNLPPLAVKNPECLGLLHKMDKLKDTWVQHYCILKDGCLYLYSGIRATHAHGGIYLHGYTVREQSYTFKKTTIELKPPSDEFKTFYLCAENPNENKRWIVAIKASIKKWLPLHQALQDYMNRPPEETRM